MPVGGDKDLGLGTIRVFPSKTPIYHQGDLATRIYCVNSGVVMTFRVLADSERQITGFCTEGEFFGLSTDKSHRDGAMTVTSAGIQSLNITEVEKDPKLQRKLMLFACQKVEDTQNLILTLTRKSSEERVATFLMMLAKRRTSNDNSTENLEVSLSMSRWDIADYLSLSRETVSRRLTDLQTKGLIDMPDVHTVHIKNSDELGRRAAITAISNDPNAIQKK